jgi:hypothetical protein
MSAANGPAGPANAPANAPAGPSNAPANGPATPQITPEMVGHHLRGLLNKLDSRIKRLSYGKESVEKEISILKQGADPTHRIQTLRKGRVINKGRLREQRKMKKILHQSMIVTHDIDILLIRYTDIFNRAREMLESLHKSFHNPHEVFNRNSENPLSTYMNNAKSLSALFGSHAPMYDKIYDGNDVLRSIIKMDPNEFNSENSDNSNNNAKPKRTQTMKYPVRFRNSMVRRIPNRDNQHLIMMEGEPLKREGASAAASSSSSSSGGSLRTRTRRLRRHRTRRA